MGFPRQEHWSGLPFPAPENLPNPGIEPTSLHWQLGFLLLNYWEVQSFFFFSLNLFVTFQKKPLALYFASTELTSSCESFKGLHFKVLAVSVKTEADGIDLFYIHKLY